MIHLIDSTWSLEAFRHAMAGVEVQDDIRRDALKGDLSPDQSCGVRVKAMHSRGMRY